MPRVGLILLFVVVAAGVLGTSPAGAAAGMSLQQTSSEGGVTLRASPRELAPMAKVWEFDIALESHTQNLADDLKATASLIADGGAKHMPIAWEGDPPGGHHRKGVLRFAPVEPRPDFIELRVFRPGEGAPRRFRWPLR